MTSQSDDTNRLPTVEERMALSHDIFKIDNSEMARALTIIEEKSHSAILRRPDDLLINFDGLSAECFHLLNKFVLSAQLDNSNKKVKKKRSLVTTSAISNEGGTKKNKAGS